MTVKIKVRIKIYDCKSRRVYDCMYEYTHIYIYILQHIRREREIV